MRRSVRFRITMAATLVVAILLLVAGLVLVALQRSELTDGIDQSLSQRADDLELLISADALPEVLSLTGSEGFATIAESSGDVVVSSPSPEGGIPPVPAPGRSEVSNGDDTYRVLVRTTGEGLVIYLGTPLELVGDSTSALTTSLGLLIPMVLVLLVGLVWWLVGRTLRPVEDIRKDVSEIGSRDLHRRILIPNTEDEIQRLAVTMNLMLERLETSVGKQQRFVADVSHELRSPLTRLRAGIETANRVDGESETMNGFLADVIDMQRLVEDMLYLARVDAGKTTKAFQLVDLDDVVFKEADALKRNQDVSVDITEVNAIQVMGDRTRLERAVKNLASNAGRHAATKVKFKLASDGNAAFLQVIDDGGGVPAKSADSIFERFTRLDEARSVQSGGAGLGLAIAKEIVEAHAGTLRIANPGQPGAVMEISIPLVRVEVGSADRREI